MLIHSLILSSLIISVSCQIQFQTAKKLTKPEQSQSLHKRDSHINFIDDTIAYYVNISVGSQNQSILAVLDTGSSDLWFPGSNNSKCKDGKPQGDRFIDSVDFPEGSNTTKQEELTQLAKSIQNYCSSENVFNYHDSKTWNSNDTEFKITYLDGSLSTGIWGTDSITLDGITLNNFSFAVTNNSNASAILGIGLLKSETTYLINDEHYTYANFPQRLKNDGIIDKVVYSLIPDVPGSYSGSLLIGGVDHSKYIDELETIPMISDSRTSVELNGIGLSINDDNETLSSDDYETLLDSGTTTANFPKPLLEKLANKLGSSGKIHKRDSYDYYDVDCSYLENEDDFISLTFQNKTIKVPLKNMITEHDDQCLLKILSLTDDMILLGDIFLSSMYIVYDLEDLEVSIAQLDLDPTSESDIEKVGNNDHKASISHSLHNLASKVKKYDVFSTVLIE
ncbi:Pepsin A [Wickerhamomyces ciferrii]|uniref:Pepsin A n=1 Tax=Wickerhamomyces ciferrii (strain ATCC 14091 / BCRC 22168 / CBS 111 / JCM 3599 / NBRC 0793 / NRRL Y-1031 F-60-10) TaxID=1206466 RepID=K0KVH4_WICCF|nr:Pepsin A [Wickerhamomyces ciferrii]CCH45459.1 Pepsin A [Wickerhamomyces ciferrii]